VHARLRCFLSSRTPGDEAGCPVVTRAAHAVRSRAARENISEGTRLFALAGRPTKAQFARVYGPKGPAMTWEQRAKAGVDAKHFQEALRPRS